MYPAQGSGCVSQQTQNIPCGGLIRIKKYTSIIYYILDTRMVSFHHSSCNISSSDLKKNIKD